MKDYFFMISNKEKVRAWLLSHKLLLLLGFTFLLLKSISSLYFIPDVKIYELHFGFGEYIRNIVAGNGFVSCSYEVCAHSTRMPFMPIFYSWIAKLNDSQIAIALIKNLILSLFSLSAIAFFYTVYENISKKNTLAWGVAYLLIIVSPPVIKHSSMIKYEEGLLIELLLVWSFGFIVILKLLSLKEYSLKTATIVSIVMITITIVYLTKSSTILLYLITFILSVFYLTKSKSMIVFVSLSMSVLMLSLWGIHNYTNSGKISIMSSHDGENLFRGNSSMGRLIYPYILLDRLVDSPSFYLGNDTHINVNLPHKSVNDFNNEWEWNDYYKSKSIRWIKSNPKEFLQYTASKVYNFFIAIKKSPHSSSNNIKDKSQNHIKNLSFSIWLFLGRVFFITTLIICLRLLFRGLLYDRLIAIYFLVTIICYSTPFIVGFNYERHITPFIVLVMISFPFLVDQLNCNPPISLNYFFRKFKSKYK